MADFTDAADREAAWFRSDQSANGIPALLKTPTNGAPFTIVKARLSESSRRGQGCFIWLEHAAEHRHTLGRKLFIYSFVATCLWTRTKDASKSDIDEASFEAAIAKVFTRIRGLKGDKTHTTSAGSFLASGEFDQGGGGQLNVTWQDPLKSLYVDSYWRADVRWQAHDIEMINI